MIATSSVRHRFLDRRLASKLRHHILLHLQHIVDNDFYQVEIRNSYEKASTRKMRGRNLANIELTLPEAPDSALVLYSRIKARR